MAEIDTSPDLNAIPEAARCVPSVIGTQPLCTISHSSHKRAKPPPGSQDSEGLHGGFGQGFSSVKKMVISAWLDGRMSFRDGFVTKCMLSCQLVLEIKKKKVL